MRLKDRWKLNLPPSWVQSVPTCSRGVRDGRVGPLRLCPAPLSAASVQREGVWPLQCCRPGPRSSPGRFWLCSQAAQVGLVERDANNPEGTRDRSLARAGRCSHQECFEGESIWTVSRLFLPRVSRGPEEGLCSLSDSLAEAGLDPGEAPASSSVIVRTAWTISTRGQQVTLLL